MDTRDKRSSAVLHSLPWRGMFPAPDGSLNQADRQHTCNMYRGIAAAAGSTANPGGVAVHDITVHQVAAFDNATREVKVFDNTVHQVTVFDKDGQRA